jgi:hypothetical protein
VAELYVSRRAGADLRETSGAIDAWEVAREVGNVHNNRPELMEALVLP